MCCSSALQSTSNTFYRLICVKEAAIWARLCHSDVTMPLFDVTILPYDVTLPQSDVTLPLYDILNGDKFAIFLKPGQMKNDLNDISLMENEFWGEGSLEKYFEEETLLKQVSAWKSINLVASVIRR